MGVKMNPSLTKLANDMHIEKSFSEKIIQEEILRCEEQTLINVLTQFLQREPKTEDFKRCTKYCYPNVFDSYELAYDNINLGTIKYNFADPFFKEDGFSVSFQPKIY